MSARTSGTIRKPFGEFSQNLILENFLANFLTFPFSFRFDTLNDGFDRLCGLVVRVPGYRSRGPGTISGATRFSEKQWVWNGVHSAS
jgi:hypothetical protein